MHNMKRIISTTLISVLLLAMAVPAFADSNRGNDKQDKEKSGYEKVQQHGQSQFIFDKMLKNFSFMDGMKIKVHKKNVKFDVQPVIKAGRTLIPVRAITEAMGADVNWAAKTSIVTITSADGKTIIMFYLGENDNGKVTVNGEEVTIDAKPGTINNRTFVPLRFIAETLGFNVNYNHENGETDCDKNDEHDSDAVKNTLALTPAKVSFANPEIVTASTVAYSMDAEYDLVNIKNLSTVLDSGDYTVDNNKVTIKKSYMEDLTADKTVLTFVFEDSKDLTVEKTFEINIDQDGVYAEPTLALSGIIYNEDADIKDLAVAVDMNDHTLTAVKNTTTTPSVVVLNTAYTVEKNIITFKESFLKSLEDGKTVLTLVFEAIDKELVNLDFSIEK